MYCFYFRLLLTLEKKKDAELSELPDRNNMILECANTDSNILIVDSEPAESMQRKFI